MIVARCHVNTSLSLRDSSVAVVMTHYVLFSVTDGAGRGRCEVDDHLVAHQVRLEAAHVGDASVEVVRLAVNQIQACTDNKVDY